MTKIKLKNFLDGVSVFGEIDNIRAFPFITPETIDVLDTMLVLEYGERNVYNPIVDCNIEIIAKMIVVKYGKAWDNYVLSESLSNNINDRTEITEIIENNDEVNRKEDSINKVSAYNAPDLIDDTGSSSDDLTTTAGRRERTLTDERVNVFNSYKLLGILSKDSIIAKVQHDIVSFMTINIY